MKNLTIVLCVAGLLCLMGCSGVQCWWGECKTMGVERDAAQWMLSNDAATEGDLTWALRDAATYCVALYDDSRPFGGFYLNSTYRPFVMRLNTLANEAATRAEAGSVDLQWKKDALLKISMAFEKLQLASVAEK